MDIHCKYSKIAKVTALEYKPLPPLLCSPKLKSFHYHECKFLWPVLVNIQSLYALKTNLTLFKENYSFFFIFFCLNLSFQLMLHLYKTTKQPAPAPAMDAFCGLK